jgi:hypothetical protein
MMQNLEGDNDEGMMWSAPLSCFRHIFKNWFKNMDPNAW